jgi:simple sugar transport system permease protein
VSTTVERRPLETEPDEARGLSRAQKGWLVAALVIASFSAVRVITGAQEMDSPGTINAAIGATTPILLAGLGGLWSERSGVVNIGLEGQILLGTWGAAYFTYYYGPTAGLFGAVAFGMLGGLIHALATVTFGVDHIVSGVALNVVALGLTTFLAEAYFSDLNSEFGRGGQQQLTGLQKPWSPDLPFVSDWSNQLADKHWFVISDLASFVAALTTNISIITLLTILIVIATSLILWRTRFGLRLRSCGENPQAAESLGVNVYLHKYIAVIVSGGLAGLGGAYLVASTGFHTNQAGGRGYIGLASMIFGNWNPLGVLMGAGMFGYTDSLRLRDLSALHALLLLVGFWLLVFAAFRVTRRRITSGLVIGVFAVGFLVWYFATDSVPRDFSSMTPYVVTLLVLAFASQRLRMPKADGQVYRKGSAG